MLQQKLSHQAVTLSFRTSPTGSVSSSTMISTPSYRESSATSRSRLCLPQQNSEQNAQHCHATTQRKHSLCLLQVLASWHVQQPDARCSQRRLLQIPTQSVQVLTDDLQAFASQTRTSVDPTFQSPRALVSPAAWCWGRH